MSYKFYIPVCAMALCLNTVVSAQVFTNGTAAAGLTLAANAQGVSWGDYDNDGDEDLLVPVDSANAVRLFTNNGSGVFTSTTGLPGQGDSNAGTWFDYDRDGDLDLFVGAVFAFSELYRNDGGGTFVNVSSLLSATDNLFDNMIAPVAGDFDKNGYADLFLTPLTTGDANLYSNTAGTFTNTAAPPVSVANTARGASGIDYDNDSDIDLYLVNGDSAGSRMFRNNGAGSYTEVGVGTPLENVGGNGRGAAWGDLDNDGDLDCVIANATSVPAGNRIVRNDGGGVFTAVTGTPFNTGQGDDTSPLLFDYDNDGDLDIAVHSLASVNKGIALYRNDGSFTFVDVTAGSPALGAALADGRGLAVADPDNDGDLDMYQGNANAFAVLDGGNSHYLVNSTNNANWLKVKVVGTAGDKQAFGAQVKVFNAGTSTLVGYRQIQSLVGYQSMNSLIQHFGVPGAGPFDVKVTFLNGGTTEQLNVTKTQQITITEVVPNAAADWSIYE